MLTLQSLFVPLIYNPNGPANCWSFHSKILSTFDKMWITNNPIMFHLHPLMLICRAKIAFNAVICMILIIAELQRAKLASEAPWVRKMGNPSSRENLVMTSAYERTSFVRPYRLWGKGRGVSRYSSRSPLRETNECHLSLAVFCLEKSEKHSFLFAMSTKDRRGWSNVSR